MNTEYPSHKGRAQAEQHLICLAEKSWQPKGCCLIKASTDVRCILVCTQTFTVDETLKQILPVTSVSPETSNDSNANRGLAGFLIAINDVQIGKRREALTSSLRKNSAKDTHSTESVRRILNLIADLAFDIVNEVNHRREDFIVVRFITGSDFLACQ